MCGLNGFLSCDWSVTSRSRIYQSSLFVRAEGIVEDECQTENAYGDSCVCKILVVFFHSSVKGFAGNNCSEPIPQTSQNSVPDACTKSGEEDELAYVHSGQSGRNGYKLSDCGNQTAQKCGDGAMVVEITFGVINFFAVDEASVAKTGISKFIH